jgi:hypothetical protein
MCSVAPIPPAPPNPERLPRREPPAPPAIRQDPTGYKRPQVQVAALALLVSICSLGAALWGVSSASRSADASEQSAEASKRSALASERSAIAAEQRTRLKMEEVAISVSASLDQDYPVMYAPAHSQSGPIPIYEPRLVIRGGNPGATVTLERIEIRGYKKGDASEKMSDIWKAGEEVPGWGRLPKQLPRYEGFWFFLRTTGLIPEEAEIVTTMGRRVVVKITAS